MFFFLFEPKSYGQSKTTETTKVTSGDPPYDDTPPITSDDRALLWHAIAFLTEY